MFKKLKGKVESSILYSRIEAEMSRVTHPVKNKVKKEIAYAKEHPVKTTAKVIVTAATVCAGGAYIINHLFKAPTNIDLFLKTCKKIGLNYTYEEAIMLPNENNIWIQELIKFNGKGSMADFEKVLTNIARDNRKLFMVTADGKVISEQAFRSIR